MFLFFFKRTASPEEQRWSPRLFAFRSQVRPLIIPPGSCNLFSSLIINGSQPTLGAASSLITTTASCLTSCGFNHHLSYFLLSLPGSACPIRSPLPTTTARFSPGSLTGSSTATTTGSGLGSEVRPGAEFCLHSSVRGSLCTTRDCYGV